jgi:hypothetical protein
MPALEVLERINFFDFQNPITDTSGDLEVNSDSNLRAGSKGFERE